MKIAAQILMQFYMFVYASRFCKSHESGRVWHCSSVIVFRTVQLSSSADAGTITSEVDINEVSVPCRNLLTRGVTQDDVCITLFHSIFM